MIQTFHPRAIPRETLKFTLEAGQKNRLKFAPQG